jgi:hypothetical protein
MTQRLPTQLSQLSLPRLRADFSFQSMKTTILIDLNSLVIKDIHYRRFSRESLDSTDRASLD